MLNNEALTALRDGHVASASRPARSLSPLEAITGQFSHAILTAELMGIPVSQSPQNRK